MMKFSVKHDIAQARREVNAELREINKGIVRALERVTVTAVKAGDQAMRQKITLPSRKVKDSFTIVLPYGRGHLIRDITVSGDPIPLRDWAARKSVRKGATFAVIKGQRKQYRRQGRIGFIVERIGGHVFVRTTADPPGPAKAKIAKVFGPSLTQRFGTKAVQQAIERTVRARWPIEFQREMAYRSRKR